MSFDALATCINIKEIRPLSKLVLLILANYSNEDWQSYPSINKISELCNCDEKTTKRALDELVQREILKCQARYYGKKQISNLYTINQKVVKKTQGGQIRGGKNDQLGGSNCTPNTIIDTKINVKNDYTQEFEDFWKLYPPCENGKKIGKYETYLQFKRIKDRSQLIKCLQNYIDHKKGRFIHSPKRWLEKRIYEDFKNKEIKLVYKSKNSLAG